VTYLLALSVLVNAFTVYIAVRNVREANRDGAAERRELYQRIQAPDLAVAQALPDEPGRGWIGPDEDDELNQYVRDLDGADTTG
jgi:hypothetical protein